MRTNGMGLLPMVSAVHVTGPEQADKLKLSPGQVRIVEATVRRER
jgi:hypothetical protein